jgi:hypothetical protein
MAYTNETKLLRFNELYSAVAGASKATGATVALEMNASQDEKYLFVVTVSTAGTVIIKGNDRANDLDLGNKNAGTFYIALDSMNYKNLTGANKGKVVFAGTFVGTVTAVVLP